MEGVLHYHRRKRPIKKTNTHIRFVDNLVFLAAIISPVMTIPQLVQIWAEHSAAGVSLISWGTYLLVDLIWLYYGLLHKSLPLIASYMFWVLLESVLVLEILIYK